MTNRFRKQVTSARVKRIRFHDLRHTSAVIGLRELGEAVDEVSKRLGHESTAFTLDTYGPCSRSGAGTSQPPSTGWFASGATPAARRPGRRTRRQEGSCERFVSDEKEDYQLIYGSAIRIELKGWLAARDTIRTLFLAPPPDVRAVFDQLGDEE